MKRLVFPTLVLLTGMLGCGTQDGASKDPFARARQDLVLIEQSARQAFLPIVAEANEELARIASKPRYQVFKFGRVIVFVDKPNPDKRPERKNVTQDDTIVFRVEPPAGAKIQKWTDTVIVAHELDLQYSIASVDIHKGDSLATPYVADVELEIRGQRRSLVDNRALPRPPIPPGKVTWMPPLSSLPVVGFGSFSMGSSGKPKLPIPKIGTTADRLDHPVEELAQQLERQETIEIEEEIRVQLAYQVPQGRWVQQSVEPELTLVEQLPRPEWTSSLHRAYRTSVLNPDWLALPENSRPTKDE